ncbi:MAG: DUF3568 family protein [Rhodospirillaceae bacterium]|jgi:hypothetical protein|nr:DUF3568 family protein [Rhodospirillaceae bacterium]MBT3883845.1 DUF3568 family protein [Rhodospirillaceae bacterium]MBT4117816.1 DUF3568 family protein [Rhodospirillaceae bacterium]MBT4672944.1 DUF3568 family protein [Rhodospirillaceae bacterium]MBT4720370.1 DUF3568 family protein [Rhodospirillaceae bacterium]
MNKIKLSLIAMSMMTLAGCGAAALTVTGVAAGAGVDHSLSGITYKTFAVPADELRQATLVTLARLDMDLTNMAESDAGWDLNVRAAGRDISIELETLTRMVTRMRVTADEGFLFFRDTATSTEIILQTVETLDYLAENEGG